MSYEQQDLAITTAIPTLSLEDCDETFTKGVLLIKDAVLNYAQHGLTAGQIGQRVRDLGGQAGDSTIARWIAGFKAEKLLPEKELSERTERRHKQQERERSNSQTEKMAGAIDEADVIDVTPSETGLKLKQAQQLLATVKARKKDLAIATAYADEQGREAEALAQISNRNAELEVRVAEMEKELSELKSPKPAAEGPREFGLGSFEERRRAGLQGSRVEFYDEEDCKMAMNAHLGQNKTCDPNGPEQMFRVQASKIRGLARAMAEGSYAESNVSLMRQSLWALTFEMDEALKLVKENQENR